MAKKSPNVLLIFVDNQPAKMMGCAGNDEVHTPNLDKFATQGVRFSEAFCPNAMCSPCRASVLTGLMPSQHGIHTWLDDAVMDTWPENWNAVDEFYTLPERLKDNGYHTSLIGKFHLGIADTPKNGFDDWITLQIGHVLSFYDNKMIDNGRNFTHPGHSVDFFTQRAVDTITERAATPDQPFFMFLTYPAPYGFWPSIEGEPTNRHGGLYKDTPFNSVPREAVAKQLVDWMLIRHDKLPEDEPDYFEGLVRMPNDMPTLRNYYSQMSMVDEGVGKVLAALDTHNLTEDTLIIYTSDHGMALGEHGFWGHGEDSWPSNTHREANHIPMIVKPPHAPLQDQVCDNLVGTTDIFATVLDYAGAGVANPEDSAARSLRPLLESSAADWEDVVFMEQEETRSIRTARWNFMRRFQPTSYHFGHVLYDLAKDPDERTNVAEDPEYAPVVAELCARLDKQYDKYADPKWNLWEGGRVKSNSTRPFLWEEVWGKDWQPTF
ncbi:sulfatase-like hydrolase/transferase [Candidatus Halocynthiibacter alkanivorans]|uniref:sulfatase-like hydrolase/transferase n=1 Tax=Candidatus Halocynthiibacter alkanivorans TaxID=2267619 RepID=UPI000DF34E4E|nr:sulfatase-like hydrolase/transferase [Candidatus Halocynthiibacter alkanivorans]